jgi:hypothetical protein
MTVSNPNSFRRRRLKRFLDMVDSIAAEKGTVRILDVGGTRDYWTGMEEAWRDRPVTITVVNISPGGYQDDRIAVQQGDACSMPEFADGQFDVVHSNSVIEHVGHWDAMTAMAKEIARLAPRYFVQTPNVWFPLEVHFNMPFYHWLPEQARASLLLRKPGKYLPRGSGLDQAMDMVQRVNLLSARQMRHLFPGATLERERILGLSKSLIAIR